MVVNPSFPAKTIPEFIAYAKSNGIDPNSDILGCESKPVENTQPGCPAVLHAIGCGR
jgi:hypothetical protein